MLLYLRDKWLSLVVKKYFDTMENAVIYLHFIGRLKGLEKG